MLLFYPVILFLILLLFFSPFETSATRIDFGLLAVPIYLGYIIVMFFMSCFYVFARKPKDLAVCGLTLLSAAVLPYIIFETGYGPSITFFVAHERDLLLALQDAFMHRSQTSATRVVSAKFNGGGMAGEGGMCLDKLFYINTDEIDAAPEVVIVTEMPSYNPGLGWNAPAIIHLFGHYYSAISCGLP